MLYHVNHREAPKSYLKSLYTHVNPWPFHFNVWQNSLQIKKKKKKRKYGAWVGAWGFQASVPQAAFILCSVWTAPPVSCKELLLELCDLRCIHWCLRELHPLWAMGSLLELLIFSKFAYFSGIFWWHPPGFTNNISQFYSTLSLWNQKGEKHRLRGLWSTKVWAWDTHTVPLRRFIGRKGIPSLSNMLQLSISTFLKDYCLSLGFTLMPEVRMS